MSRHHVLHAALAALLCIPFGLGPAMAGAAKTPNQPRYRVVGMGSLGGDLGILQGRSINRARMAVGLMSTGQDDPYCTAPLWACFYDGTLFHAFLYSNGKTYDLGALGKGVNSTANGITELGLVYGQSQNGKIDHDTGFPQSRAVAWVNRKIFDLGTLGGTQSTTNKANLIGQTVGGALNAKPNPFADAPMAACPWSPILGAGSNGFTFAENTYLFIPGTTETHATLWWGSLKLDMGTLGGPDSVAADINDLGQTVGWSYTSYHANEFGVPDVHPFVWNPLTRKMQDLGTLGGACAMASSINNRGEVIGYSKLADNTTSHPFVWTAKGGMRDLGTLGGTYAHANEMNDRGEVIGYSTMVPTIPGQQQDDLKGRAFYWSNGVMKNLGTFGDDYSDANGINNKGQIVGEIFTVQGESVRGWISDRGGPIVDLNTLIDPYSGYTIIAGGYITDDGVIGARATTSDGEEHPVMLIPLK